MRRIGTPFLWILLLLTISACSNNAELNGKVVDAKGKPLTDVEIVATPLEIKENNKRVLVPRDNTKWGKRIYEKQRKAVSGSDGFFTIKKLEPDTKYFLIANSMKWKTKVELEVRAAQGGEISTLPENITIRYTLNDNIIADSLTGLEWYVYPVKDMDWNEAEQWSKGLSTLDGGGWRMPTLSELQNLYEDNIKTKYKINPIFDMDACCVWTDDKKDSSTAKNFSFKPHIRDLGNLNNRFHNRAFAVRTAPNKI